MNRRVYATNQRFQSVLTILLHYCTFTLSR